MVFRSKGKLAASVSLAAMLALSPVAAPVATALAADGNAGVGVEAEDAETYTVTFIFGNGLNDDKVETYEAGKRVSRPTGYLAAEGETIYGWYTDPELTNEYYFNTGIDQDLVLYAKWGESEHTVTYWNETSYDDMTDATPYLVETVEHGKTHPRPDDPPARDGYKFEAWYSDKECTQRYNFRAVKADTDVYAGWTKDPTVTYYLSPESKEPFYTVTVDLDLSPDEQRELLNKSAAFEHLKVEIPEGYEFDGFYTTPDYSGSKFTNFGGVKEDTTLYVKFKQTPVVTYDFQLEGVEDQTVDVYLGDYADPMTYDGNEGNVIAGWYTDPGCTEEYDFTEPVMGDMTLYAKWGVARSVTFDDGVDGNEDVVSTVANGEPVAKPADPVREGYDFAGWYTDEACTVAYDFAAPVEGDMTLYAKWDAKQLSVTFDDGVDGNDDVVSTVDYGEPVSEPADPTREGYDFAGWYTDEACTVAYDFTKPVTGDMTLYAKWDQKSAAMYRLYNPYTGEHFYTSSAFERDSLVSVGWESEGEGWVAPSAGAPVYRLYNPYVEGGDHHYTLSVVERDSLVEAGWEYEGVGWYSASDEDGNAIKGAVPIYRQYNPYATTGTHNYTTSEVERDSLVAAGWNDEGIAWYGIR